MKQIIKNLKTCVFLFRIKLEESLQYRMAAIAGASIGIFWAFLEIVLYTVFYTYGNILDNAALLLPQVISYAWLGQMIFPLNYIEIDGELRGKITSGDIGIEMCRPLDFYAHWFAKMTAGRLGSAFWRISFTFAAAVLIPRPYRLGMPASAAGCVLFLLSLVSAFILCGAYSMLITAVRLGITWGEGPTYMLALLGMVLGGGYLPLQLWPDFLQRFLLLQPFAGYMDIPIRLYVGSMPPSEALAAIGLQFFWIIVFIAVGKLLMNHKLKNIIVQGG